VKNTDLREKLLSMEEFGDWLGLKAITIRKWIASRKISSVKLGRKAVRIPISEFHRLVALGLQPALQESPATAGRPNNPAAVAAGAARKKAAASASRA
jgi:excisionase family DNA binding protein